MDRPDLNLGHADTGGGLSLILIWGLFLFTELSATGGVQGWTRDDLPNKHGRLFMLWLKGVIFNFTAGATSL